MTPKVHSSFKLNGENHSEESLSQVANEFVKSGKPYEKETGNFLLEWLNNDDYIITQTSGSTGTPKSIKLQKQAMLNSAIATGAFFNLKARNKALHCLPSHYIAGKMMLVRALVLGLDITTIEPKIKLSFDKNQNYDFCAMIPMQVQELLKQQHNIKTIIIGGSKIPAQVVEQIKTSHTKYYETYGMTETVTHVAIKALQSKVQQGQPCFLALPNITFKTNSDDCLIIEAPRLSEQPIQTNDVVKLISSTSFKLLGRIDNVINSGGKKIHPEAVEQKLQSVINNRFFIASKKDETLGEKVILIIENENEEVEQILNTIRKIEAIDKHEVPKDVYYIQEFVETPTGKINRKKTMERVFDLK